MTRSEQFLRRLKIPVRLTFGYLFIFISVLIIADAVLYYKVRDIVTREIESKLKITTDAILDQVRLTANASIKNHLRAIAETNLQMVLSHYQKYQRGELSETQAKKLAARFMKEQKIGKTGYPYVVDSKGIIQVHPVLREGITDLSRYPFIQQQMKLKSGYLEYQWKNPGEPKLRNKALYMVYFEPWDWIISASSYRNEFYSLIDIDSIKDSILSLRFGETGYPYVLNGKGDMIIHPFIQGNFYHVKDHRGQPFFKTIVDGKNGSLFYSWKNPGEESYRDKFVVYNYLPEFDWIVVSSTYSEEFYQPLKALLWINIAFILLMLLLTIPLSLLLSSSIISPLKKLVNRLSLAASGDFSVRIHEHKTAHDELSQVSKYFNHFMDDLERYSNTLRSEISERKQAQDKLASLNLKLEKLNHELEERVAERTRQLQESFDSLKLTQKKLVEAEKMASLANVVAGVAHEINTPLGTSITAASYLADESNELKSHIKKNQLTQTIINQYFVTTEELIEMMMRNLNRASDLVKRFKSISVRSDQQAVVNFNLYELLDRIVINTRQLHPKVEFFIHCPLQLEITSYQDSFIAIFDNLVNNSIVHGFEGRDQGQIEIEVRHGDQQLIIHYRDNGVGMDDEHLQQIFEPFFTTKRGGQETGLGMHLVYNLVTQQLKGEIYANSTPGQGCEFTITLPIPDYSEETA
ncbi:cache domain-containing protein [Dongshaea marina]|uniref:cache domain-containing protein n=1 Tax=Dongshaea marina TaxID=2047966 RepID=UPI000D3E1AC2|nr:cache domain-containing protein [Dongshaea marina]